MSFVIDVKRNPQNDEYWIELLAYGTKWSIVENREVEKQCDIHMLPYSRECFHMAELSNI